MRTLDSVLTQRIKQLLAMVIGADADGVNGVEHAERLQLCLAGFEVRRSLNNALLTLEVLTRTPIISKPAPATAPQAPKTE